MAQDIAMQVVASPGDILKTPTRNLNELDF
jgi:hypothetical protein